MSYANRPILVGLIASLQVAAALSSHAQEPGAAKPIELDLLKGYVGVWDAEIEVWPAGPEAPSIKFNGVEKNRPYGQHWISSDFDSEYGGQVIKVHSIVGYDLDKQKMFGMIIDDGPYAATMTGEYDPESKAVTWMTAAKTPDGQPMVQKTLVTHMGADERVLVLSTPGDEQGKFKKFMQIRFVRRK